MWDLGWVCRSGSQRRGLWFGWSWKVGSYGRPMGDPQQKHCGPAVFLASSHRSRETRRPWGKREGSGSHHPELKPNWEIQWFHVQATSHLCEACSPRPGPEPSHHAVLPMSPYCWCASRHTCSSPALEINPRLCVKKKKRCLSGCKLQDDVRGRGPDWSPGRVVDLGLLGVIV